MKTFRLVLLCLTLIAMLGCGDSDPGPVNDPTSDDTMITLNIAEYEGLGGAATGTVTINPRTGKIDTTVSNLPTLTDEKYEGWLAGGGETPTSTGRFNTDANGVGSVSVTLGDLQDKTFAFYVITIEPEPDPDKAPDPRHSIGAKITETFASE